MFVYRIGIADGRVILYTVLLNSDRRINQIMCQYLFNVQFFKPPDCHNVLDNVDLNWPQVLGFLVDLVN